MEAIPILLIIAAAGVARGWYGIRNWCPHCNKWNGLKKIDSEHHRTETRYRTETLRDSSRDGSGRTYRTRERQIKVPYNVDFYKVLFECKSCHKQVQKILRSGQYFKEAGIFFGVCAFVIVYGFNQNKTQNENKVESPQTQSSASSVNENANETKLEENEIPVTIDTTSVSAKEESQPEIIKTDNVTPPQQEEIKTNANENVQTENETKPIQQNEEIKITKETPEYKRIEYAISMLKRGKNIDEIVDSTFLSKHQVKKLKRNL